MRNPLRRRSSKPEPPDMTLVTTVRTADPTMPIFCATQDCPELATKWVVYLWRAMERDSFVAGMTEEDVCENHFQQLINDEDVHMEEWGTYEPGD